MELTVGATVVHPQHGVATVEDLEEREFDGNMLRYIVLRRPADHLTLRVPENQADEVGLRQVIDPADVDEVIAVLREEPVDANAAWRKQHNRNEARLNSGDVRKVAMAVRDLAHREAERGLSTSDRVLYDKARGRLIGELTAALGEDEETVERRIDDALGS